jgi:hypothetical protein
MKTIVSLVAAAAVLAAWTAPASAAPSSAPGATSAAVTQDLSAAKKKRRHYRRTYDEGYYVEPAPYPRAGNYGGADPTAAPNSNLRFQQSLGRCVIDLGYGRYKSCN